MVGAVHGEFLFSPAGGCAVRHRDAGRGDGSVLIAVFVGVAITFLGYGFEIFIDSIDAA